MKTKATLPRVLPLLLAAALGAQEKKADTTKPKPATGSKSSKSTLTVPKSATGRSGRGINIGSLFGPTKDGVEGEHQKLSQQYMRATLGWHKARVDKMRAEGKQPASFSFGSVPKIIEEWAPQFMATAKKYKGKDAAMPFLGWCLYVDRRPHNKTTAAAIEALHAEPLSGPKCAATLARLANLEPVLGDDFDAHLARLFKSTKTDEVKAALFCARAKVRAGRKSTALAIADYKKVLELAPKTAFAESARGALNGLTILAIGMPAPEIEGKDLDGTPFKLSDYRGKAVMLSFWGHW